MSKHLFSDFTTNLLSTALSSSFVMFALDLTSAVNKTTVICQVFLTFVFPAALSIIRYHYDQRKRKKRRIRAREKLAQIKQAESENIDSESEVNNEGN